MPAANNVPDLEKFRLRRFVQKLGGGVIHAATASSRTLARNGVPAIRQSPSPANTVLMLTSPFKDNDDANSAVRSTSAP